MQLLVLAKAYPPTIGGVENYSKYVAEGLSKYHNVSVLTFSPFKTESVNKISDSTDVKVKRISPYSYELLNAIAFIVHYLLNIFKKKPDLIIATTWKIGLPCALFQSIINIPYVQIAHGAEVTRIRKNNLSMRLMRLVFKKAVRVVSVSKFTDSIVKEYTGAKPEKCNVVSNGIDISKVSKIDQTVAKERIGLSDDIPLLLSVSRLDKRKGHAEVIRSLPKMIEKVPKLQYIIVGNGPEKESLVHLVEELDLETNVTFAGYVYDEDLPFYYSACDVFIMLNSMYNIEDFEGFGFVFAEAGAYRKPAIAGDNSGPREVIDDGVSGFLVNPSNHGVVVKCVVKLLERNSLRQSMGDAALERVKKYFTIDKMVGNLNQILISINDYS